MSTKITLNGIRTSAYLINGVDNVITLSAGSTIAVVRSSSAPYGIYEAPQAEPSNSIIVNGRIYASMNQDSHNEELFTSVGVFINSTGSSVQIGATGSISASTGVFTNGENNNIVNRGTITVNTETGVGIDQVGSGRIDNFGTIEGYVGVDAHGFTSGVKFINEASGVITAYRIAVSVVGKTRPMSIMG